LDRRDAVAAMRVYPAMLQAPRPASRRIATPETAHAKPPANTHGRGGWSGFADLQPASANSHGRPGVELGFLPFEVVEQSAEQRI
jgi:hypothetical protein